MCGSKMSVDAAEPTSSPTRPPSRTQRNSRTPNSGTRPSIESQPPPPIQSDPSSSNLTSGDYTSVSGSGSGFRLKSSFATNSISSPASLSSLRLSLPENPQIYDLSEIRSATNNFLAKRHSASSTPSWRCYLRGKDVVVFQRKLRRSIETAELKEKLFVICRSHHMSIIKLAGASISGDYIYLAYEFMQGGNLADCLRNPRNPNFTVLSTWMSRMQIATDLAHGLDYIHNKTGMDLIHKHVKSSSVIVTEPSFNAKICHFATAVLCGETVIESAKLRGAGSGEIKEEVEAEGSPAPRLRRSDSRGSQFEGVTGYMSPEFLKTAVPTQKSDVYAFGIVILELLSGQEPVKFRFDRTSGDYRKISVVETAMDAVELGGDGGDAAVVRLRRWVDRRLKDSFPVEVVERMTRIALECVHVDPDKRPNMQRVAGKISKMYLDSRIWSDRVRVPTDFSVSLAPR